MGEKELSLSGPSETPVSRRHFCLCKKEAEGPEAGVISKLKALGLRRKHFIFFYFLRTAKSKTK